MNILDKAKRDERIKPLLNNVEKRIKLRFVKNNPKDGWGCLIKDNVGEIYYSGCRHPSACLAHELLHIKLQLDGYSRPSKWCSNIAEIDLIKNLMKCIDNELQHHKIYSQFLELGFSPEQFYADSDKDDSQSIKNNIAAGYKSAMYLIPDFFYIIALGGNLNIKEQSEIKTCLLNTSKGAYKDILVKIENIINDWRIGVDLNSTEVITQLFLAIEPNNNATWFAFDEKHRPPNQGFFVDEAFKKIISP